MDISTNQFGSELQRFSEPVLLSTEHRGAPSLILMTLLPSSRPRPRGLARHTSLHSAQVELNNYAPVLSEAHTRLTYLGHSPETDGGGPGVPQPLTRATQETEPGQELEPEN